MSNARIRIAPLGLLLIVAACLAFMYTGSAGSEEARYRRAVRNMRLGGVVRRMCMWRWLPRPIARPLDELAGKPFRAYDREEAALLASGFLTNVTITLTNAPPNTWAVVHDISRKMHAAVAVPDNTFPLFWRGQPSN